jgi:flagella basal body P-ring formation protein FlgA
MRRLLLPLLALAGAPAFAADPPASVPVLVRNVERGEILSPEDFEDQPRGSGLAIGAVGPARAAGREAVRNLTAGAVVRSSDLVAPRLVRRGEPVAINLRSGALTISTSGRALTSGGRGDMVRVVTTVTNRTIDGIVEGSGAVRITAF